MVKPYRIVEQFRDDYLISTDPSKLNLDVVFDYLTNESYWACGRPRDVFDCSIENSLNFGIFFGDNQIGFARIVTDRATFAWICDVFVLPAHRGKGIASWMIESILKHPDLQGLRSFFLATRDAHALYAQFGFKSLEDPSRFMMIRKPTPYR